MDIVTFLLERLGEDEERALAAGNRKWLVQDNTISLWPEEETDGFMSWPTRADARHAAAWDPARVLAELAAKRAILAEHTPTPRDGSATSGDEAYGCRTCHHSSEEGIEGWGLCLTIKLLAAPYQADPGYDGSWRP